MRELVKVVFHTLDFHHRLLVLIDGKCLVFHAFRSHVNLWQLLDLRKDGVVGWCIFPHRGNNLQLRVECSEE